MLMHEAVEGQAMQKGIENSTRLLFPSSVAWRWIICPRKFIQTTQLWQFVMHNELMLKPDYGKQEKLIICCFQS